MSNLATQSHHRHFHHTRTQSDLTSNVLLQGDLWKQTVVKDYVIKRHVRLYKDSFVTFVDPEKDPKDHKRWHLYGHEQLVPADKKQIVLKRRHTRPDSVGSITPLAMLSSKAHAIELYTFTVDFPFHNLRQNDFTFGFETREQAEEWHDHMSSCIADLRYATGKGEQSGGHHSGGHMTSNVHSIKQATWSGTTSGSQTPVDQAPNAEASHHSITESLDNVVQRSPSATGSDLAELWDAQLGLSLSASRRWVPFRVTNGMAIYQHPVTTKGGGDRGGEYMASVVVRSSPAECLKVLMDPASNTTILGPASEVEVLESEHGRQVLRIRTQAPGFVGRYFRPREAVVQRMLKVEEDGVFVVLFSSIDTFDAKKRQVAGELDGVTEEAAGLDPHTRRDAPVRMRVNGGYTICRLDGARGNHDSKEALITMVLHVEDLGSWLSESHWLFGRNRVHRTPLLAQAYDAYVERMLMSLVLARDQVEQSRFAIKPYAIRSDQGDASAADTLVTVAEGFAAGGVAAPPQLGKPPKDLQNLRSASVLMRNAYRDFAVADGTQRLPSSLSKMASPRLPSIVAPGQPSARPLSRIAEQRPGAPAAAGAAAAGGVAEVADGGTGSLDAKFWSELHVPGRDYPFKVRGPTYLRDHKKVPAGDSVFELTAVDAVFTDAPVPHISRYLRSVRRNSHPYSFVFNLMVPGAGSDPTLSLVLTFSTGVHPETLGQPPEDPDEGDWDAFDYVLYRFIHGTDEDRSGMVKVIPHMAEGSWVIKQSVGTTPVLIAHKLTTTYHFNPSYVEVAVDIGSNSTANYITGMVRGAVSSLVVDLALTLQGDAPYELPESVLGAARLHRMDLKTVKRLDMSKEIPLRPRQ